ncbi:MAG: molybdopterin molybdotransferase MoeA [Chromatiales bacterium]
MTGSDCESVATGPALKTVEQALEFLLAQARPIVTMEKVAVDRALGRVLSRAVLSPIDVPPWRNSAMDGYAINSTDLLQGMRLPISQRIAAGTVGKPLVPGTAARIFTGAPVPEGADTVVIQEDCHLDGETMCIQRCPPPGANIRLAGEDIRKGNEILVPGVRLGPQHLGLAASVGVKQLSVYRRLRVAVFSSGDELVMPGDSLGPGQIYNSNQFTLTGLLQTLGCEVISLGIVDDTFEATCEALAKGSKAADLVIASGGVSVGEEDHVKPAVEKLGRLDLWKIAIRPGKPLAFGHIAQTPFIGTPGNPVSLFVTFCLFARPFILRMQGTVGSVAPLLLQAQADFTWDKPVKRREYARARVGMNDHGITTVRLYPTRSSGVLSSVAWANALVVIPEHKTLAKGDAVSFIPFSELLS